MAISKTANLVLVPIPGMGYLVPAVELARHMVARHPRLSITLFIINLPLSDTNLHTLLLSLKSDASLLSTGITFHDLPPVRDNPTGSTFRDLFNRYMENCRPDITAAVEELRVSGPAPVAGFVLDMFCTAMVDVATELGLPSYIFVPSNAALLTMMLHLEELGVDAMAAYGEKPPDTAVEIPGFRNPVPLKFWPAVFLEKDGSSSEFFEHATRFRKAAGILVNTFSEMEPDLIQFLSENNRVPPIYPVGPILNLAGKAEDPIFNWLDEQPPGSVVFLCFGSRGGFEAKQAKEIAGGLEQSGRRFLWSLRRAPEKATVTSSPSEFEDLGGVLPEGFLDRTAERGRVIGWAPQAAVLAHRAVGAFVTHCGWNSTLESLWFGVPMAAWPMYAEQQLNAIMLVREMGLAAEIRMDYQQDLRAEVVVGAAEVAEGIRGVVDEKDEGAAAIRRKVKTMSETARKVKMEGGSSHLALGRFIESVLGHRRRNVFSLSATTRG